jgi:hypothetical protein
LPGALSWRRFKCRFIRCRNIAIEPPGLGRFVRLSFACPAPVLDNGKRRRRMTAMFRLLLAALLAVTLAAPALADREVAAPDGTSTQKPHPVASADADHRPSANRTEGKDHSHPMLAARRHRDDASRPDRESEPGDPRLN